MPPYPLTCALSRRTISRMSLPLILSVETWFKERLPFVPPVRDLSAQGYALEGGRLDHLYKRSVAALVYRHGDHLINVFVWPASGHDAFPEQMLQDDGFHI